MTPIVNGKQHHFAAWGLYDGLFLMGDAETGSYWDHITGKCVHGALKGTQLDIGPLHHLTAKQTAVAYPDALFALSKMPFWQRFASRFQRFGATRERGILPPRFRGTMGEADTRLPRMTMGLGVWTEQTHRFYPTRVIKTAGNVLQDELDGRRIAVYIDPAINTPTAVYNPTKSAWWEGERLHFDNGAMIQDGMLYLGDGQTSKLERPFQLFTRWYGFAYTFPGCGIYQNELIER